MMLRMLQILDDSGKMFTQLIGNQQESISLLTIHLEILLKYFYHFDDRQSDCPHFLLVVLLILSILLGWGFMIFQSCWGSLQKMDINNIGVFHQFDAYAFNIGFLSFIQFFGMLFFQCGHLTLFQTFVFFNILLEFENSKLFILDIRSQALQFDSQLIQFVFQIHQLLFLFHNDDFQIVDLQLIHILIVSFHIISIDSLLFDKNISTVSITLIKQHRNKQMSIYLCFKQISRIDQSITYITNLIQKFILSLNLNQSMEQEYRNYHQQEGDIWALQLNQDLKLEEPLKGTLLPENEEAQQLPCLNMGDIDSVNPLGALDSDLIWDCELPNIPLKLNSFLSEYQDDKFVQNSNEAASPKLQPQTEDKSSGCKPVDSIGLKPIDFSQKLSASILKTKQIKKGWKKNTNLPKFLVRVYMKYFEEYTEDRSSSAISFFKRVKKEVKSKGSNAFKIQDILRFIENPKKPNLELSFNNRKTLAKILRETCQEEIVESNYIHENLKSYLVCSKVYRLRCRSKYLAERVKIN